jgi:hypothetical protein
VTIAPLALLAVAVGALLALRAAGAGFHGDPLAVVRDASPGDRLFEVADRRGPVVGVSLLVWLGAFGLALAVDRERAGRVAARLFALTLVCAPLVCLLGAALEPSVGVERLLLMLGSPALAALMLAAFEAPRGAVGKRGATGKPGAAGRPGAAYGALAFACAATVLAHAADLVAGSPLTQLSLFGPNPAAGHRYYGIGNELEAILIVLTLVGTGAALSVPVRLSYRMGGKGAPEASEGAGRGVGAFLAVGLVVAFVFAYGGYGADVGAAIALPLGAAVAAAVLAGRPRLAWWALAVPLPALAVLAAADLLSGANAHLTRTVLQADGGDEVLAVLGHRLREAGESFGRPLLLAGLPLTLGGALLAWLRRGRLAAWLRGYPAMRAGLLGALAATVAGTLANDSGALLLELGAAYLAASLAFAWAEAPRSP